MNKRGFTLLELLISITMLVLITGIIGWSLNSAHRALERGEKKIHDLERMKASFTVLESQIRSLFPYQFDDDEGQKQLFFSGSKDKLMFASNYSLWRGTKGNTLVTYDILTNDAGKQFLKITEQVVGVEEKNETVLLEDCSSIHFEYLLKNALEEEKWLEEWPAEENGLPHKIKINIARDEKKISLLVESMVKPVVASSSTAMPK